MASLSEESSGQEVQLGQRPQGKVTAWLVKDTKGAGRGAQARGRRESLCLVLLCTVGTQRGLHQ